MNVGDVPTVRLGAGDDASGMASMLADLLGDNLRDYPARSRVARMVRGAVVMTASDHGRSVTVRFNGPEIVVDEGADDTAPCMVGPWLDLAQLCSGRLSPMRAVADRRLTLRHLGRPDLLAAAGYVMSVPASYYGDGSSSRQLRRRIAVATAVTAVAGVIAVGVLGRRRSPDGRAA